MSRTIILLWGAPAAGKSSIARDLIAQYRETFEQALPWINTDAISRVMVGDEFIASLRPAIYDGLLAMSAGMLESDFDVLLDGNYILKKRRDEVRRLAQEHDAQLVSALIHCRLEERLRRNRLRPEAERIPEPYVRSAHEKVYASRDEATLVIDAETVGTAAAAKQILDTMQSGTAA